MYKATVSHADAIREREFLREKNRLYCSSDLHILTYLFNAVKPVVTGETYITKRLKNACIWQAVSPKSHLPAISSPIDKGMTIMAANKSLKARAMM